MTIIDFKPCKKAVMELRVDSDAKETTYKTIDPGLYYGTPILEKNRVYNGLEYRLIRHKFQELEGYKGADKWIKIIREGERKR